MAWRARQDGLLISIEDGDASTIPGARRSSGGRYGSALSAGVVDCAPLLPPGPAGRNLTMLKSIAIGTAQHAMNPRLPAQPQGFGDMHFCHQSQTSGPSSGFG